MDDQPADLPPASAIRTIAVLHWNEGRCPKGSYGIIFFPGEGRAIKVFYENQGKSKEHIRQVFQGEVDAYVIAHSKPTVSPLVPAFYGVVQVAKIVDDQGRDISQCFCLDCAYEMSRIEGAFIKLGNLSEKICGPVKELFRAAGIQHVIDASAVVDAHGKISCVIDFSIREHEFLR